MLNQLNSIFKLTYPSASDFQEILLKKACHLLNEKIAFIVITASADNDKNDFLNNLIAHFKPSLLILRVSKKNIDESLIQQLAKQTNVSDQKIVSALIVEVQKKLVGSARKILLLCDDAESYTLDELEFIRQLSNLFDGAKKGLAIILFGKPSLRTKLAKKGCFAINQRITARLSLKRSQKYPISSGIYKNASLIGASLFLVLIAIMLWRSAGMKKDRLETGLTKKDLSIKNTNVTEKIQRPQQSYVFATEEEALSSLRNDSDSRIEENLALQALQEKIKLSKNWLSAQPNSNYTIQLFLLSDPEAIIQSDKIMEAAQVIEIARKDRKLYGIYIGSFTSLGASKKSISLLPAEFLVSNPFPQKISLLKTEAFNAP